MVRHATPFLGGFLADLLRSGGVVDQAVKDKDQAEQLKHQLQQALIATDLSKYTTEIQAQAKIVLGEVQGESWLQRNWRPLLMLIAIIILANNYLISPYLGAVFPEHIHVLDLPERLWDLLTLGVGGYVAGRTGEKIVKTWKGEVPAPPPAFPSSNKQGE